MTQLVSFTSAVFEDFAEAYLFLFKKLGFIPCKAEPPLHGMELQENEALKHLENLFRKNLQLIGVC